MVMLLELLTAAAFVSIAPSPALSSRETLIVGIEPGELWERNDCKHPLPDEINLQCGKRHVVKITRATFARRRCNKVPYSCMTNITLAPKLCNGKASCSLTATHLKAENCGLTTQDRSYVELSYKCDLDPDGGLWWLPIAIVGIVGFILVVLIIAVIVLWRRTKSLTTLARRQTLELQRATNSSVERPVKFPAKTSFVNHEYDLDEIIIPVTPYSTEERGGSVTPVRGGTLEGNHEYEEVDHYKMNLGVPGASRGKCPTPQGSTGPGVPESRIYLNLSSDSIPPDEYASATDGRADASSAHVHDRPSLTSRPVVERRYADMTRGSRVMSSAGESSRNSLTPGYVRVSDVTSDDDVKPGDRRSKTDGYYLVSDFMERQK